MKKKIYQEPATEIFEIDSELRLLSESNDNQLPNEWEDELQ
jgi:hypothetical protein